MSELRGFRENFINDASIQLMAAMILQARETLNADWDAYAQDANLAALALFKRLYPEYQYTEQKQSAE